MVRGCASLDIPDLSVPNLQSVLLETVHATHVNQLKCKGSFDVFVYLPGDAAFPVSDMAALPLMDRFAVLRDSLTTVLHPGLNKDIHQDADPLRCIALLKAVFVAISD